jgi:hypothetical protein
VDEVVFNQAGSELALYMGDVSGDVLIEATDPTYIYCTLGRRHDVPDRWRHRTGHGA